MSDIQEEQKRLYKRAEENDYDNLLRKYNNLKTALDESQEVVINYKEENNRLNNIIKNLDKMFEYYFLGNLKYDQDTVNTIYIKYVKLKELNIEEK